MDPSALRRLAQRVVPAPIRNGLYRAGAVLASDPQRLHHHWVDTYASLRNLARLGFRPGTVIDVGAFEGEWTVATRKIFPDAAYLLVEPLAEKRERLRDVAARAGGRVVVEEALVGAAPREGVPFYAMATGSSVLAERTQHPREARSLPMTTLDALVARHDLKGGYLVKLDVQGFELEVLKGATRVLEDADFLLLETSLLEYNEGAPLVGEVVRFLGERGYVMFDVCDTHRKAEEHVLMQMDVLFARADCEIRRRANRF